MLELVAFSLSSILVLVVHVASVLTPPGIVTLDTRLGRIRGTVESLQNNVGSASRRQFYAFRSVPYAKPPIEKLRWKVSLPFD